MISQNEIQQLAAATVYDNDGDKIGQVGQVYLDTDTNAPEWVSVRTGLFGTKETFVPLDKASLSGDRVTVLFGKAKVKDAPQPQVDVDGALSPADEDELYTYYGLASSGGQLSGGQLSGGQLSGGTYGDTATATTTERAFDTADTGYDTLGPSTDDAMTRSEERVVAGTRKEQVGKARLRKYVVTEQEQVTVPVSREEVRVEREPITDANIDRAMAGPDISDEEHEVTLHAERPVVDTETVPVERVRLTKETVTDHESVSAEVRKEQIEFDDADGRTRP